MRKDFAKMLNDEMSINSDLVVVLGDVGYGVFDELRENYPKRVINPGASEQLILGLGVGLALEGKIPILYSITPFILFRPFEFIRNYLNHEKIPVKLVGSGRDLDYGPAGFTHHSEDDIIINNFKNIVTFKPENFSKEIFNEFLYNKKPSYLNLKR